MNARAVGFLLVLMGSSVCVSLPLSAQGQTHPVIDTIVIVRERVFPGEPSQQTFIPRIMNALHVVTRPWVIRNDLLFREGQPVDSVVMEESERNLRARQLFKEVTIDTARVNEKLAAMVRTQDSWSTKPNLSFSVATDGTWTGRFGLTESNLVGTGNLAHAAWVKEIDRTGPEVIAQFQRLFGTQLEAVGSVNFWDDGREGFWRFGDPWRSTADRLSVMYDAEAASRRVLRYRVEDLGAPDTTFFRREAQIGQLTAATTAMANARRYIRVGLKAGYRTEDFSDFLDSVTVVPDSTYGEFSVFGEFRAARYRQVRYFNGFIDEDIDVSTRIKLTLNGAVSGLGYARSGVGPRVEAATGTYGEDWLVVGVLKANGLFTDAGLDSGRVTAEVTLGLQPWQRHSTVLYVTAGAQENPPPGEEFDLGFIGPPRSWEPHAYVGTRTVWGTVEHRWFAVDALFGFLAVGFAGFFDYGGAWYPDQDPRFGGNVGIGLRLGSALSSVARTGRIDVGCRVGNGSDVGTRCVLSFGGGFAFPWDPDAGKLVAKTKP